MKYKAKIWLLAMGVALVTMAANATTLFKPVGRPPEVFAFNSATMTEPLTSNPYALNSPKVYLIFLGPDWEQNGMPIPAVNSMIADAKEILNSPYLSGLKQYGSDGIATYAGFTIDTSFDPSTNPSFNPVWFETDRILSNPTFSSWNPPPGAGNARTSPIYVVVRYGGGPGGSNAHGPNQYTSRAINVIDDLIPSADSVDWFSWVLSHEVAERMSSGIGGLSEVYPDSGGQIADGEPEIAFYAGRLNGRNGPLVTSYWSVLDQAFIIPDGSLQRVLQVPIWNATSWTGKCISLREGSLYEIAPPDQKTLIDNPVHSYAISSFNLTVSHGATHIFDLTANGQVKEYSGSGNGWTPVTGSNTTASALVATADGNLYMLATNDGGPYQIWQYSGSGTNWTAVTGTNTTVSTIAAAGGGMYMLGHNEGGDFQVWQYSGSLTNWTAVTGTNTSVSAIAATAIGDSLYMLASNGGGPNQVWRYNRSGTSWTALTGTNTSVFSIQATGDVLSMTAARSGEGTRVWQYSLDSTNWMPLTGTNTSVGQVVVQDGIDLYMVASNDGGTLHEQVWQYDGTPYNWTVLTGMNTDVSWIYVGTNNRLYMNAANDGGISGNWIYDGTPYRWTEVQ